jgi:hypothetical protein
MRLLVSKRAQRRHFGIVRKTRIFRHNGFRVFRTYKEDVERQNVIRVAWQKLAFGSSEIESAERMMKKHSPSFGPNNPGNWHAAAMGLELVGALAATHFVDRTARVELWSTFTQTEQMTISGYKREASALSIEPHPLQNNVVGVSNSEAHRICVHLNTKPAAFH